MSVLMPEPKNTMLGQSTIYPEEYDSSLIQPIPRALGRDAIGDHCFRGVDVWRLYELTWLSPRGIPRTGIAEILVPASTPSIVESKSLKLYAGSFALTSFVDDEEVTRTIRSDLSAAIGAPGAPVEVRIHPLDKWLNGIVHPLPGVSIDFAAEGLDLETYEVDPSLLKADPKEIVDETLSSTLFRSLCPVTGQPDYASVMVHTKGPKLDRAALLAYLVSYRCHRGFHEQCVEQIYHDLRERFDFEVLEVYACFTRRGGIDINPFRSNISDRPVSVLRTIRQ